ncbi:hypothetical protein A2841_01920 [Candidatus Kaiserbacteria bacterium RIFCSPHIGHO2_01_FULL_48_10]|uniref:VCBS repeat-containing protein n=1 Tax=Candidatus Kaiserbacteria bacterium RIFCSPHIGHO2_01_FULL_48_10 TaxID=1798476 RepID=A0A1F6C6E8_9BACT|nr:MAG: hypothetical protein A2841_01920 [Candidatus Kaiserbacteria bacterium RIFCSPHIGHO2_01_FULL_48_10]
MGVVFSLLLASNAFAVPAGDATLCWDDPDNVHSPEEVSDYPVYRGTASGGYTLGSPILVSPRTGSTPINEICVAFSGLDDGGTLGGQTYFWAVTARDLSANESGFSNEGNKLISGDLDGDGMSNAFEAVYGLNMNNASDATLDSDGDGLTNLQEFQFGTNPAQLNARQMRMHPDYNGDGKTDIDLFEDKPYDVNQQNAFWVAPSNGSSFTSNNPWFEWGIKDGRYQRLKGDFNGDGKSDILLFEDKPYDTSLRNGFFVALSDGTRFVPSSFAWAAWGVKGGYYQPLVGDFNGDGKSDILLFEDKPYDTSLRNGFFVALSDGTRFVPSSFAWAAWGVKGGYYQPLVGDFNGDGKSDILLFEDKIYNAAYKNAFWVALSSGSAFTPNGLWLEWGIKDGRYSLQ